MMKVFFVSLPFDEKNSGDYDYCQKLANTLNQTRQISAEYITGNTLGFKFADIDRLTRELTQDKKNGGKEFYDRISKYCSDSRRQELAYTLKEYVQNNKAEQNILNIQLRPPETGFLLTPQDLEELQTQGFKVCITCHEYKLNYDRRWLQTILHPYFKIADLVLFFNEKDMRNASKHANRSAFLDDILNDGNIDSAKLSHKLLSTPHLKQISSSTADIFTLSVTKAELLELKCDFFIGELKYDKGLPIRYSESGKKTKASPPLTLEWGIRTNLEIPKQENKFSVSGVIINSSTKELSKIQNTAQEASFKFDHNSYDLNIKSKLTRVPPTIGEESKGNITDFMAKPPNIIIFGLIRQGKGYENAIDVITEISHREELKTTRLIILGNPSSLNLLAEIIRKKFDCSEINEDILENIANESQDTQALIRSITEKKLRSIKSKLIEIGFYSEGMESLVYTGKLASQHNLLKEKNIQLKEPSLIQKFIWEMASNIPEVLPIDIFLNIPQNELKQIFACAKYAIKYDGKGWANNASGLINLLSYGCILYTSWGMCTADEVTTGQYKGAIVLPKGKYCLKQGEHLGPNEEENEKRQHFKITMKKTREEKKQLITAKMIAEDIIARENGASSEYFIGTENNQTTFERAEQLLNNEFTSTTITSKLIGDWEAIFNS
jgi:hypothetical protein